MKKVQSEGVGLFLLPYIIGFMGNYIVKKEHIEDVFDMF